MNIERVEIYRDSAGEWRWVWKSANNKILGDSGEGYQNRGDLEAILASRLPNLPHFQVADADAAEAED